MRIFSIIISFIFTLSLYGQSSVDESYPIKVVNFEELYPTYTNQDDILYVVNFWATWCRPCVEELPHFMEINRKYRSNPKFRMILVSLDDPANLEKSVKSFARRLKLDTRSYLLDDIKRMNDWIPSVDKGWTGSIPATLFIKNGKTLKFSEGVLSKEELEEALLLHL